MSPYGKFYLTNAEYRFGWWEPFESWRTWKFLDHIFDNWGELFPLVGQHLDVISSELRHS